MKRLAEFVAIFIAVLTSILLGIGYLALVVQSSPFISMILAATAVAVFFSVLIASVR